jgi:hypothetical protein
VDIGLRADDLSAILRTTALSFYEFDSEPAARKASASSAALQRAL